MDQRARDLLAIGNAMFSALGPMNALRQALAENFYPERADFTRPLASGEEFASDLMSSYPVIARRELGNLFASMLRPRSQPWFELRPQDERLYEDTTARAWCEWATGVQRRAMYDPAAHFVRAASEADHDFATFGNSIKLIEATPARDGMLYRCFHPRDCAWSENHAGKVDTLHRKWTPTARQLVKLPFRSKLHEDVTKAAEKEPERQFQCRNVVVPADEYDLGRPRGRKQFPFVWLQIEDEHETVLEETPLAWFPYVVSRWKTIPGSPYGRSPAAEVVLADARTLQALTEILLEAGEKAVDPPMIAVAEALRSDVNLMAGGLTTVDIDYDERTGDALRAVQDVGSGLPIGIDMAEQLRSAIADGFFLNKINLPEAQYKQMTAFETRRRIEEHIRASAPIFEPIEAEDNAPTCEVTFEIMKANGAFGPPDTIPDALRGAEVQFFFQSPLRDLADEMKGQVFLEGLPVLEAASKIDPAIPAMVNVEEAARDSLRGFKWPAKWLNDAKAVEDRRKQVQAQEKAAAGADVIAGAADVADKAGGAMDKMNKAGMLQELLGSAA